MTQLLGWPLALVPLAGVLGAVVRPATRRQAGLYVFAGAYWLCMGFVFYAPRFFLPMILPYMVLGASLVRRWNGDEGRLGRLRLLFARSPRGLAPASLVVLVLVTIGVQAWRVFDMERNIHARRPLALLEAARVLERSSHDAPARPRLMARKGHLAYHAGFDFAPIAPGIASLEALVRQAQQRHAGYVAYSYVEYSLLPHLLFMAVTDTVPLLRETYRGPGVRVFRVPEDTTSALSHAQRHELLRANLKAARLQGRPAAVLAACEALGSHHLRRGEPAPAADFFAEALALAEGAPGDDAMARAAAMARHNLAAAKIGLGQPATAIGLLQRNLDYFATAGSPADIERTRELLQRAQARRDAASIPTAPRP